MAELIKERRRVVEVEQHVEAAIQGLSEMAGHIERRIREEKGEKVFWKDRAQPQASQTAQPFVMLHSEEKLQSLEERLHAMEAGDKYGLEAADLCLVLNVRLSVDFKTPKFNKYKGSSCPRVHMAMYCRKMVAYIYDDKILVHFFQDNLTGVALSWYVSLERGRIKTWRELAKAFLKQYKYNKDMTSDRSRL
ncbi:hypothetical protein CR513_44280, partial [Mucuna pruriens]